MTATRPNRPRAVTVASIALTRDASKVDESAPGYQPPGGEGGSDEKNAADEAAAAAAPAKSDARVPGPPRAPERREGAPRGKRPTRRGKGKGKGKGGGGSAGDAGDVPVATVGA